MSAIMNFLSSIAEVVSSAVNLYISYVKDILYVVKLLGSLVLKLPTMVGWLPSACISLTVLTFTIVIIYKILGREG